ncbi:MAG: hypothetical protein WBP47_24330, partial [Candidatus Promineifilaceae bacterium]
FPAAEDKAVLAYAQSQSLVRYIQARYGNQTLDALLTAYADGQDCDGGVRQAVNQSLAELEKEWLANQQPQTPLVRFFSQNGLWLLLVAGGFLFTGLIIWQSK